MDNDDILTLNEVEEISRSVYALLGQYVTPKYDRKTSDDHAKKVFAKLDPQGRGFVSKEDFVRICLEVRYLVGSPFILTVIDSR